MTNFIKDGKLSAYEVIDGKVIGTFKIGGTWVSNVPIADFLAAGWQQYDTPPTRPYVPTYEKLVEQYIRDNGFPTYGAELAIINNFASNPEAYADKYNEYMTVRERAKEWASEQLNMHD